MANKENWLLIRGLVRGNDHWGIFPDLLRKKFPDSQVILLELPGNGEKFQESSPLKIADYVEALRQEWLNKKDSDDGKWNVIAISMGAMVAMEWEKQYSDFHKMFLINTSSSDVGSPFKRLSLKALKNIPKILFTDDPSRAEKTILELTTELTEVNESLVNKWKEIALKYPISKRNFIRQLYAAAKFRSPRRLDIIPTFLAATNDNLADFNSSKKLAKKYNSQIFIHESAGHDLPLDDPDWIIAKLTVF